MKKIWILERYETKKELMSKLSGMMDMVKFAIENEQDEKSIERLKVSVNDFETMVNALAYDEGILVGWEGKSNYKVFCNAAIDAINRDVRTYGKSKHQFRVVEAEIEDYKEYWVDYKFIKVNDGVTRYLYAARKNFR